jgi:endogenous inhibitor of DNA gyrase (YacG/DUF329 family)
MKVNLDDERMSLDCPKCGRKFQERIGRLKNSPTINCPGCGQPIKIEASSLRAGVNKVQASLDKLGAAIGRIGKKR